MKKAIISALIAWAGVAAGSSIELTIEPVTNALLVAEASARGLPPPQGVVLTAGFPHPDTGAPTSVTANNIVHLPENASPGAQAWARTNAFRADFFACIRNTSTNTLNFYDEWNSWGFDRMKIVCYGWREVWIAKQPGVWYRNFPSWTSVRPGGVMRIPVAFDESLWDGVAKVKQAKDITGIRLFYDQLGAPTNAFGTSDAHWQGCEFSPYYDIGSVLPRHGFRTEKQRKIERGSNVSALTTLLSGRSLVAADTNLYIETYDVGSNYIQRLLETTLHGVEGQMAASEPVSKQSRDEMIRRALAECGIHWPAGSSIRYVEWLGRVVIKNTPANLRSFEAILPQSNVTTVLIESELQFVAFDRTNINELVRLDGVNQESLLGLWSEGRAVLVAAPHVVSRSGAESDVSVCLTVPGGGQSQDLSAKMMQSMSPGGGESTLAVKSDLFNADTSLSFGKRVLLVGGVPMKDNRQVLYVFATAWRVSRDGKRYPDATVEPPHAGDVSARAR